MLASARLEEQEKAFYLTQRRDGILKVVSSKDPLVNNLEVAAGTVFHCHVQKLEDSFPEKLKILRSIDQDETKEEELELNLELDDVSDNSPIDLTKDEFTLTELLKMRETEIPFLVEKILPDRAITFLAGDSDAGKSLLYTQLCTALIEKESEFLGLTINAKHNRALIINSEDGPVAITVRVKKQLTGRILTTDISDSLRILTNGNESSKRIDKILANNPMDLIVIDAFADVFQEDINSSSAVRNFLEDYSKLATKYGCTILFVHHIGKGKENQAANKSHMLGSVGTHGRARNVLMLTKSVNDPNIKFLKVTKGNYISEEAKKQEIVLKFDPKNLLHEVVKDESLKEELTTQQQQLKKPTKKRAEIALNRLKAWKLENEDGKTREEICKLLGKDKSTISRYLKDYNGPYDALEVLK